MMKQPLVLEVDHVIRSIDSFIGLRNVDKISPIQRKHIKRNIAIIYKMINGYVAMIKGNFREVLEDDRFYVQIINGLKDLKHTYDLFKILPNLDLEQHEYLCRTNKRTLKHLPNVHIPVPKPKDIDEAKEVVKAINHLCVYITKKVRG